MGDELDKLIDEGLAAYGNVEPLAGLDDRVLGKVRAAGRRRWWMWAAAIPALAAAAWVTVVVRQPAPVPPPVVALASPPAPAVAAAPVERKARAAVKARPPKPELPKRPLFPTPTKLTAEERMLVALAASHPQELLPALPDKIEIKPIEIAPLDVRGPQ